MSSGLRQHLLDTRTCGDVATSRQDNLRNYQRMLDRRTEYDFGLELRRPWTHLEVLEVMARRCGVQPDPGYVHGPDTIDVDLCLGALAAVRDRLARAAARRERVLVATGHPTGLLAVHLAVAAALRAAGCQVLVVDPGWELPWEHEWGRDRPRHVRVVNGVHVLASGGQLLHTHLPEPMQAVLRALDAVDASDAAVGSRPVLVHADHGWAGAAAQAGLEVLAYADCNDPALFVAQEEGLAITTVPLDDNVAPHLYDPVSAYLTSWSR